MFGSIFKSMNDRQQVEKLKQEKKIKSEREKKKKA